jgi:ABC-type polysaccharide/polyol phosphate transport system ATPase subunit
MSKINQIQNELRSLGDAAFQKLADSYLHKKGYEQINPIGSVIGSDKVRKGTPDTLITLSNGKYIFAEYTTQKTGVYAKFKEDLNKCFDEQKTGISVSKIEEVVFCHTS